MMMMIFTNCCVFQGGQLQLMAPHLGITRRVFLKTPAQQQEALPLETPEGLSLSPLPSHTHTHTHTQLVAETEELVRDNDNLHLPHLTQHQRDQEKGIVTLYMQCNNNGLSSFKYAL